MTFKFVVMNVNNLAVHNNLGSNDRVKKHLHLLCIVIKFLDSIR